MVGPSAQPVAGWNGVTLQPEVAYFEIRTTDLVYIPALGPPEREVPATDPEICRRLRQQYEQGAIIATACSGSILLAESGFSECVPAQNDATLAAA